ncbi:MAG: hypothetical protein COB37_00125 [Kordiimonadales bacterium]|nr:MAG: hypothetical protein COB37_00125 [Kordiimonadales bacterium]
MKFLIAIDSHNAGFPQRLAQFSASDFGGFSPSPYCFKNENTLVLASTEPSATIGPNGDLVFWDGAVIDRDVAFSSLLPVPGAASRLEQYVRSIEKGDIPKNLVGVFGCAVFSEAGAFTIAPDPLSQYAFFCFKDSSRQYFTNCLQLLEKARAVEGRPLVRSFASSAFETVFGLGGLTRTGFSDVYKLLPNHFIRCRRGQVDFVPFPSSVFFGGVSKADYSEKLKEAAEQQRTSARAMRASHADEDLVFDLSGGKDTRLLLGAQLATKAKAVQVFLGGPKGGLDQQAASRLVQHFGLDSVQYSSNVGGEDIGPVDVARRSAYRFQGTSNLHQTYPGSCQLNNVARVRGTSSEARTRSFFSHQRVMEQKSLLGHFRAYLKGARKNPELAWSKLKLGLQNSKRTPQYLLPAMLVSRGGRLHRFFHKSFLNDAYSSISDDVNWLSAQGVAPENLADTYYIFDRGWRICGFPAQVMNSYKTIYEPFNDLTLLEAQFALAADDRDNARVALDLFRDYAVVDLLEMPFDQGSWPGDHLSVGQAKQRAALTKISTEKTDPGPAANSSNVAHSVYYLGGPAYMKGTQRYMLEIASGLPQHHHCWDYLRRDEIITAIETGLFLTPKFSQDGLRLLHSFIWLAGDECREPIAVGVL